MNSSSVLVDMFAVGVELGYVLVTFKLDVFSASMERVVYEVAMVCSFVLVDTRTGTGIVCVLVGFTCLTVTEGEISCGAVDEATYTGVPVMV